LDIWKPQNIEPDTCLRAQIGPLLFWFKQAKDELHIATERLSETDEHIEAIPPKVVGAVEPKGLDWNRWIVKKLRSIRLIPAMPDRAVVVRTEIPVKIPTGLEAIFFVGIPVWVKVIAGDSEKFDLYEQPIVIRSNTWFGDPISGELCYSLTTRARREILEAEIEPHRCICPVKICNASPTTLEVDKLCIHVEHLKIFEGTKQLWANEVKITYKGEDLAGEIKLRKLIGLILLLLRILLPA